MTTQPIRQLAALALLLATFLALPMTGHAGRTMAKPPKVPTPTPAPTATAIPCSDCPTMYVDLVNINAYSAGYNLRELGAFCEVRVRDEAGNFVDGALVTVQWGGVLSGTEAALTALAPDGISAHAEFSKVTSGVCRSGDTKISTCTVTNVFKDGMAYDPTQNVVVTDSDDHCGL